MIIPVLQDARNFGWELNEDIKFNWKKLLNNKVCPKQLTFIFIHSTIFGIV